MVCSLVISITESRLVRGCVGVFELKSSDGAVCGDYGFFLFVSVFCSECLESFSFGSSIGNVFSEAFAGRRFAGAVR
jgi:hypothetical protein